MNGSELIAAERERQKSQEGWSDDHDDDHGDGGLAVAASCYASFSALSERARLRLPNYVPGDWPWAKQWWKPTTPVRDLVKAGALIAAEIDRRLRAGEAP